MVYVDDFKMSGPAGKNMARGWTLIKEGLALDTPGPVGRCLGCHHVLRQATVGQQPVNVIEYHVTDFMKDCVTAYKKACNEPNMRLKRVDTPFLAVQDGGGDPPNPLEEGGTEGALAPIAASILMKILYGARAARWNLLKAVQHLASRVTKWSQDCDKALHRLICYIDCTSDWVLRGFVGDNADEFKLHLYADADFAGDRPGFKSTSGAFLTLSAPTSCFPLAAKSQKQTSVSHSTPEAEIVAANSAVRTIGFPALDLWESVLQRKIILMLLEDNESTYQIIKSGKNPTMRHITRTHGVNIQWLHDLYKKGEFRAIYTSSESQCADIFTKSFKDVPKWKQAVDNIGVAPPGAKITMPPKPGMRETTKIAKAKNAQLSGSGNVSDVDATD